MTADEYEQLPPEKKEHFAMCAKCGEIFDRRSLDGVLFHGDHKHRPNSVFRLGKAGLGHSRHVPVLVIIGDHFAALLASVEVSFLRLA
jgi:hypothetical protein